MYQRVTIVGNLGGDPEMRHLPSGKSVTNFSVATNRKWSNSEGEVTEEVVWWRVSAFGRLAEVCNEYLAKGRQVLVEGRMRPDSETGSPRVYSRNDGTPGASYELTAASVQFLGSRVDSAEPKQDDPEPESIPF